MFFWLCPMACGILVPQPWITPMPPTLEAQSLNHWTTWEVPGILSFKLYCFGKLLAPSPPFQIGRELTNSPIDSLNPFCCFNWMPRVLKMPLWDASISVPILAPYSTHFLVSIGLSHSAYTAWLYFIGFSRETEPIN